MYREYYLYSYIGMGRTVSGRGKRQSGRGKPSVLLTQEQRFYDSPRPSMYGVYFRSRELYFISQFQRIGVLKERWVANVGFYRMAFRPSRKGRFLDLVRKPSFARNR